MHLLFLDESGQLSERRFFALGGVALRDRDWHRAARPVAGNARRARVAVRPEIKWHGIRNGEVPPALADAVVGTLARSPLRCYVALLDIELGTEARRSSSRTDEDTYATGLMFLAERFQLLLEAADDVGMIVVDSRFREDDARLRRFFADLTKDGSPTRASTGSSRVSSSGRATSRSASSAPTSCARSPPRPSAGTAWRAAT